MSYTCVSARFFLGESLQEVGAAFKNKLGTVCQREDVWVTGKLWNSRHAREDVVPALKETLKVRFAVLSPQSVTLDHNLHTEPCWQELGGTISSEILPSYAASFCS